MASLNFPTAPADQQTYSANGITYQYDAAKSRWDIVPPTVEFETSAQLDLRDTANRSRSNHTGTQTASTISDFDTEVSNNTDVAANTSARHDAVTVVDSSEIDFTLTGQQITASIVAGSIDESKLDASVNASLDLADSSVQLTGNQSIAGTKTFTTALILPNNSRVNGVEHFYQTTKPTTRGDSSALVAGDRWWKTDDGTEWFWNGSYWLSQLRSDSYAGTSVSNTGGGGPYCYLANTDYSVVLHSVVFKIRSTPSNSTDNWTVQPQSLRNIPSDSSIGIGATYNSFTDWNLSFPNWSTVSMDLGNTVSTPGTFYDVRFYYQKNGSAGGLAIGWASLYYHLAFN